jgi:hypothetical protein
MLLNGNTVLLYVQYTRNNIRTSTIKLKLTVKTTTRKIILDMLWVDNGHGSKCLRTNSHQNKTLVRKTCAVVRSMSSAEYNAVISSVNAELQCCS